MTNEIFCANLWQDELDFLLRNCSLLSVDILIASLVLKYRAEVNILFSFDTYTVPVITFRVSRRRREMYSDHPRLCLSACLSSAACLHYCTDPDVTWGNTRGCPLVVHYWADLQSGHGLRCYGNITRTRNVSEYMLVLALCLVKWFWWPTVDDGWVGSGNNFHGLDLVQKWVGLSWTFKKWPVSNSGMN